MQKFRILDLGVAFALFFAIPGITNDYPQLKLSRKKISFCGKEYLAWVAKNNEDRQRGLMNFRKLKANEAMLFEFDYSQTLNFWMKNVSYDLDIAYFSENKKLVSYMTMKGTTPIMNENNIPTYPSGGLAKYAVEVQAGTLTWLSKNCRLTFN